MCRLGRRTYRGTSLMRNNPYAHHRALDMSLLSGPREKLFLMSEVPVLGDIRLVVSESFSSRASYRVASLIKSSLPPLGPP